MDIKLEKYQQSNDGNHLSIGCSSEELLRKNRKIRVSLQQAACISAAGCLRLD
jgi:hypothetical protein